MVILTVDENGKVIANGNVAGFASAKPGAPSGLSTLISQSNNPKTTPAPIPSRPMTPEEKEKVAASNRKLFTIIAIVVIVVIVLIFLCALIALISSHHNIPAAFLPALALPV